jgi:anti-anti-sigma factor
MATVEDFRCVVDVRPDRDRVIVGFHGELDIATRDDLNAAVNELRDAGWQRIAVDLHKVSFIDSQGLRLLLRFDTDARRDGWEFAIVDRSPAVRRLLSVVGLSDHFARAHGL